MSGRKKAGSWQEGVARSFSRLFSRNHSQDKEESYNVEKSALGKEINQEIKQGAETPPACESTDRQEDENNSLKSEDNSYQPSVDPIEIADNKSENNSSTEVQGHLAANEATHADNLPRLPPDVKATDHDRQPKDFLQFLGTLFNFTPKTVSAEVKPIPIKKENPETSNDQKDQCSLYEAGPHKQTQPDDVSSLAVSTSKEEAGSTTEDTDRKHFSPASPARIGMASNKETTNAPKQLQRREDAPAVTYATYRGSRQIRKLLKRRASVDSTIPEKEDHHESQSTFTVTESGEIENVGNIARKNEGHLPNGTAVGRDTSLAQYHIPNTAVKSNALVKNISLFSINEKSNSLPNLSQQANSIADRDKETDKEPYIHRPVSASSEVCNKLISPETLLNNCIVDKDDKKTSSTIPGVVNLNENTPSSGANENIETSNVLFQPESECPGLEHGAVCSHHIYDKVDEEMNLGGLEISPTIAANENIETSNICFHPKSESLSLEHSAVSNHHIYNKVDNEIKLEELGISPSSAANDNRETSDVPFQPQSDCPALEHGAVSNHHIYETVSSEINLEELEFSSTSEKKVVDKTLVLIDKSHNILNDAEKKLAIELHQLSNNMEEPKEMLSSLTQVYDLTTELNYSAMSVQEYKVNNFPYTPKIENNHFSELVPTFEMNGDNIKPLPCSVVDCDASLAVPKSGGFNETSTLTLIYPAETTCKPGIDVPAAKVGSFAEGNAVPISMAHISTPIQEPDNILLANIAMSSITKMNSPDALSGDMIDKSDMNIHPCDGSKVSKTSKLQFEDGVINNMSSVKKDECGSENAVCPQVASHDMSVAREVHLNNAFLDGKLTDDSCFTLVSYSTNANEFSPDTLHSDGEMQRISDLIYGEKNFEKTSPTILAPKSVMFQSISPAPTTSNSNMSNTSELCIPSTNAIAVETTTLCVAIENGRSANQLHAVPTSEDDKLDKIEASTQSYHIGSTSLPSIVPSNSSVIKMSSSHIACDNGNNAILSPLAILSEDCKLVNEVTEANKTTNGLEDQVPTALESGDIVVAKISMKSVNVNEVKISPCVFQSEVVKLSIHSSKAFEPEYVILPNLSPPLPLVETADTSTNMKSSHAFEKVDFLSPTVATIDEQANTFSSSIDGKNDSMLINSSPCIHSKDVAINNVTAKTNCFGNNVESSFTTSEDTSTDNTSPSAIKPERFCDIFPSVLKSENTVENSATHTVVENRKVSANNIALPKDLLATLKTSVINVGKDLTNTDSIAIAEGLFSLEMGDRRLINPCQPVQESMDVSVPVVSSEPPQSKDDNVTEVLQWTAISESTSDGSDEIVANHIRNIEGMLGDRGLASLQKSEIIEREIDADFTISEIIVSHKWSEQSSLKKCEKNKTVTYVDLDCEPQDLNQMLLKRADKIAWDVLHLSLEEIKSTQKISTQVCENHLKTAVPHFIPGKNERENSITDPVEYFYGDDAKNVLTVSGKNSNVKNYCVNKTCKDTSLSPETLYTENVLAQKAEQIIKDVMSIVMQQLSSGELKKCLDKNHNETLVQSVNPVFTENITAMDGTAISAIEPLWSNIICTSRPLNYPLKETECKVGSFPVIENGVSLGADKVGAFLKTIQNDSVTSEEENGLFSFDDSTSADSDVGEIVVDTVNANLIDEEMSEEKWNQNIISIESCTPKQALQTLNKNERACMENLDSNDKSKLFTEQIPEDISENNILSKDKKDQPRNSETDGKMNNVRNVLQHEAYTQKSSLSGEGAEDKNQYFSGDYEICLPPYPLLAPHIENVPVYEENENATPYYFDDTSLINVTNNDSDLDSFEMVQAKPFRVFPFALSPIYEDDSSQEDVVSSDISPGYSNKRSPKESSSVLSLLQSVSERLKQDNSLDEEGGESDNGNLSGTQNENSTGNLIKAHTEDDIDSSSPKMLWSFLEDPPSFLPKTEHLLTETLPSLISEDWRNLPKHHKCTELKSASRSVYYQYLQNAKDYTSEKGPRLGSILHEILMPKPTQVQVDDSVKTDLSLVNPTGIETLEYNPRPGKMVIYGMLCSGNKLEICSDVHDATNWKFPSEAWIRVVRGCWVLYENPSFQGRTHVLEEGETILNNPWDLNNLELSPKIVTIGSIQRLVKDGAIPEIEMWSKSTTTAVPICLHSEIANLQEHNAEIPTSTIIKSGVWLSYSEAHYKGMMTILEPGHSTIPADVKSLRPLKMGGLKVQLPLDPMIIIYENPNFSGWLKTLTEHVYSVTAWFSKECDFKGIGSIRVCGGVWVAYDQERYKGRQYLLEEGEYADWHAWGGVSGAVLSFRFLQADFLEASVTLYESDAEDGKSIDIQNREIPDLEQVGFCSETRSIRVESGMWVAYQQKHFCGEQYILEKGKYKCFSDWGGNNNSILSIRPVMLEPIGRDKHQHLIKTYSGEHFQGHCNEYTSEASDFKPEVPCSFRVLQGCWLLGYQGDAAEEQCVLEEGHYPDLASCGCPAAHITSLKSIDYVFAEPSISLFALDSCEGRELYFEEAVNSVLSKDLHFYTQSVWVRSGLWIAYEGANFLGKQMLLETGEILNWSEFSGWKAIGSLRPVKQPAVYVRIKNRAQDKYLTVSGKLSDARATTVCVAPYNGKDSQIWYFCRGLFRSKANHACLDVIGGRDVPGSKVALWTEHGKSRQKWRLNKDGTITSYISNELVLDVKGGNHYDKNSIIVNYPVEHQLTQKWEMEIL